MHISPKPISKNTVDALEDIGDVPAYSGNAGKVLAVNGGESGTEFVANAGGGSGVSNLFVDVTDHDVSMDVTETTLAAELVFGSLVANLIDASSYAAGQDMAIPGAGVAGVELIVTLNTVDSGTGIVTWLSPATSTTVLIGITVYHDDTRALNVLLTTVNSFFNRTSYFGNGFCNVTSELTMTGSYKSLSGVSVRDPFFIRPRQTTGDVLTARSGNYYALDNIVVSHKVQPTSGASFVFGGPAIPTFIDTGHIESTNGYIGVQVEEGFAFNLGTRLMYIESPKKHGIKVDSPIPYGGGTIHNVEINDNPGQADSGIYIVASDWFKWLSIKGVGLDKTIHIDASVGRVAEQKFGAIYSDNIGGDAVVIEKAGSNRISGISIDNISGLFKTSSASGITIGTGVENTTIGSMGFIDGSGAGGHILQDGGINTTVGIFNGRTDGSSSIGSGIVLTSTSVGFRCPVGTSTNSKYGLVIDDLATDFNIAQLNFQGNSTAATSMATDVRSRGKIFNCEGIDDWLTSVSATPDYVLQDAIFGGNHYVAVDISSSADWKQTT